MGGDAGLNSHGGGGSVQGGWGAVGAERCRCDRRCDDLHSFRPGGVSPTRTRHAAPRRQDARDERVGRPTMRTGSVCVCVCVCVCTGVCVVWTSQQSTLIECQNDTFDLSLSRSLSFSGRLFRQTCVCVSLSLFLEQQHCAELATQRERNCSIHLFFFFLLLLFLLLLHLLLVLFLVFILQDYHARTFDGQSRGTTLEQLL